MPKTHTRSTSLGIAFLITYFLFSLSLISRLSLWLDEIIDLHQIRDFTFGGLMERVPLNAGGVPLSFLIRQAFIHVFGYSMAMGRLPALIFSVMAAVGVFAIARECKLRWPLLPVLLFCLVPLQFRYALESRPYSQFLALGTWATFLFLIQCRRRSIALAIVYGLLAVAGLYTQPFAIFVFLAHFLWLCIAPEVTDRKRLLLLFGLPIALSLCAFLPWEFVLQRVERQTVAAKQYVGFSPRSLAVLVRELTGSGYVGTAALLILAGLGLKRLPNKLFWICCVAVPIVLALAADWLFGYFFAIRQVITALAPLCLLAAAGIEELNLRKSLWAAMAGLLLVVIFVAGNIGFFRKPRENWQSAARMLSSLPPEYCVVFLPEDSLPLYTFFNPRLPGRKCPHILDDVSRIAVARSPYSDSQARSFALPPRFVRGLVWNRRGPTIELYTTH